MANRLPSRRRSRKGHSARKTPVARLRDLLGLSGTKFAAHLGIKYETYSKLETGRLRLKEHHLRRFRLFAGADFDPVSNSWKAYKFGGDYTTETRKIWEQVTHDVSVRWQEVLRPEIENLLVLFENARGRHPCVLSAILEEFYNAAITSLNMEEAVRLHERNKDTDKYNELVDKPRGSLTTQHRIERFLEPIVEMHRKKRAMIKTASSNRSGSQGKV